VARGRKASPGACLRDGLLAGRWQAARLVRNQPALLGRDPSLLARKLQLLQVGRALRCYVHLPLLAG
jgi:hypothetical protein